jgi:hypothetical protein
MDLFYDKLLWLVLVNAAMKSWIQYEEGNILVT